MEAIQIESEPPLTGRHLEIENGEQEEPRVVQVAMLLGGEEHVVNIIKNHPLGIQSPSENGSGT